MLNPKSETQIVETKIKLTQEGWVAYARHADTFNLRKRIGLILEQKFSGQISLMQIDRAMKSISKTNLEPTSPTP